MASFFFDKIMPLGRLPGFQPAAHDPTLRLQIWRSGLYFKLRSEFLKLRRWSLGLRHWM
jgi:hypothetical protein